jgi:hypothetical protein
MSKYGGVGPWILLYLKCIRRCILASFIYEEETRHDSIDFIQSMSALLLFASLYVRSIWLWTYLYLICKYSRSCFLASVLQPDRNVEPGKSRFPPVILQSCNTPRFLDCFDACFVPFGKHLTKVGNFFQAVASLTENRGTYERISGGSFPGFSSI